ncbi:Ribosomal protein [Actinidia chinensis var. chinensis]|uniref:Ribosomal protein n=1 Tax=Actinidia chinensis var. chinensis TaxID=1590841 RepID=A0A2R6PHL3_ACTCC|nr:Ribosomal protein [Actinidia chinensis var. chinensis]
MITRRSILGLSLFDRAIRVFSPGSERCFNDRSLKALSQIPQIDGFRGLEGLKGSSYLHSSAAAAAQATNFNVRPQILGNLGNKVKDNVCPPNAVTLRSSIHSSNQKEFETGRFETGRNSRSMNFVRGILDGDQRDVMGGSQFAQYGVEHNADIVHIKMLRNNTFVTVTDSKGNIKVRASSGCLSEMKGGPKLSRYAAEATAEHVGRLARNMGLKTFVVKVNGFTYFKKKKQAILAFREGYTHSQSDQNPIVYIEDTTRKAHNGCRLPKKRRV